MSLSFLFRFMLMTTLLFFVSCKKGESNKTEHSLRKSISQKKIDSVLSLSTEQYLLMVNSLNEREYPKTFDSINKEIETSDSGWWTSGFYPGTLLLLYQETKEDSLKIEANRIMEDLKNEQHNENTHDLGFMMYCSFGNAKKISPEPAHDSVLLNSAHSLSKRYNDTVKAIRSWDNASWNKGEEGDFVVIIDNMMNLELLFWASKNSENTKYYDMAVNHANTTLKNHFRDDFSSYHEVIYDESTGKRKKQITNQGFSDESSWARGQAWGLYGYILMYRETKEKKYLQSAKNIADFIIAHPNLPKDKVPYWDFDSDKIPYDFKDSSAAAIIASALLELSEVSDNKDYFFVAEDIVETLMSDKYLAKKGELGGFILKHGVGNMPQKTEVDVPLTYGDYYFIEALKRYSDFD